MIEDLAKRAKEIIERILYVTIASVTPDGKPWNSPVYSAYDDKYNFYWASWKENMHSKNITINPEVFLVIYDSTVPEGTGKGVYIQAKVRELNDAKEIESALSYLYGRKNKVARKIEEFMGEYPRRVYIATPHKAWINTTEKMNGNFIDNRVEIKL